MKGTLLVGTAGQGIVRSIDDGASWHRLGLKEAIEFDGTVRALAVDPADPARVLAGADVGLCASVDGGAHFTLIDSPMNGLTVWSIAFDPVDPSRIYAGTGAPSRARMFRSTDAGRTWSRLDIEFPEFCKGVNRPRILTICVDPAEPSNVWFGVEEGGAWHSRDGGDRWRRVDGEEVGNAGSAEGIDSSDIHAIAILPASRGRAAKHFVLTVNSVYESTDGGQVWYGEASRLRFDGMYYTRTLLPVDAEGDTLLLAIGDGTPGTRTKIYRSEDRGVSWTPSVLHATPNSTVWAFGAHPADRSTIFAGTKYGHLFRSTDAGRSWFKDWREFSEITSVAWTPFEAPVRPHPQSIK